MAPNSKNVPQHAWGKIQTTVRIRKLSGYHLNDIIGWNITLSLSYRTLLSEQDPDHKELEHCVAT